MQAQFDRQKFKDLVHYICAECPTDKLGFVKLHKGLYFCDMLAFAESGNPMTGETYRKQQFGPIAQHLWDILNTLQQEGALKVETRDFHGYQKRDFVSLQSPNKNRFSEAELILAEQVIEFICEHNAKEISELTHEYAWRSAKMGEVLPYFTVFQMFPVEISENDIQWGAREIEKIANQGLRA